ncbi:MAG: methyltransferase domain-containing protein [Thermoanaerobaculia bacterium]|nr:methyltransferase domain-containing protein [Thermoanaerobaculia bacterium]
MTAVRPTLDVETARRRVAAHGRWFHEIEVAPGVITPGEDSNRLKLPLLDELGLPGDAHGLRVLDLGCSDGFFSFEMEKRGAQVVAADFVAETATGFAVARELLGSRVEYWTENVYNLDPKRHGKFDVILFLGVLYHLRKPLAALDAIRGVLNEGGRLFLATLLIDDFVLLPGGTTTTLAALNPALSSLALWQAYPGDSLNGDFTNCFAPNRRGLEVALEEAQFEVEEIRQLAMGGYVRARAIEEPRSALYQQLDARLENAPLDPSVPYFLDRDPGKLTLTGPRKRSDPEEPQQE